MSARPLALVADDDAEIRELVALRLEGAGFEVMQATDGHAALSLAAQRPPDVAVLDVMMPGDGLAVAASLRAGVDCGIVMLSALGGAANLRSAYDAGADDYVVKPFAARDLVARVTAAARRV
ncbi:MAG: response regulator [Thermoleophilia bacterium]